MESNGKLTQDRYWCYVNDVTGEYAGLRQTNPFRLSLFKTEEDGAAHMEARTLPASLRGHWLTRDDVVAIAELDCGGNYVVLDRSDIPLLKSRTE